MAELVEIREEPDPTPTYRDQGRVLGIAAGCLATMASALGVSTRDRADVSTHTISATSTISVERERYAVHSGPFSVEGFPHQICFLTDGFTICFHDRSFRIARLKALWSDLTLSDIRQKIGRTDVERIECEQDLIMHAGPNRALRIPQADFLRILQAMEQENTASITIENVTYELTVERAWSTLFIPRNGTSALTFDREIPPPVSIAFGSH